MKVRSSVSTFLCVVALLAGNLACGAGQVEPTAIPATNTPEPTATKTSKPTSTPRPTATPNAAATKQIEEFNTLLNNFYDMGYVNSLEGKTVKLDDFEYEWAQINYYDFFPEQEVNSDFVFKSHIKWSSASETPDSSGCGVAFGIQDNGDHYVIFIDKARIFFGMARGSNTYLVGKTRGSGRLNFGNPAEADLAVSVKDKSAFVSVNGEVTEYTLSVDQSTHGLFAFSILSGTNKDYGTRCEMTDIILWTAK
jgi:hypothetical protein